MSVLCLCRKWCSIVLIIFFVNVNLCCVLMMVMVWLIIVNVGYVVLLGGLSSSVNVLVSIVCMCVGGVLLMNLLIS